MPSKYYSAQDKYTYPNSPVLRNLKNIKDRERLEQFESAAVFLRSVQLVSRPITGKFDTAHLKSIHKYLFQDVYEWAGQFRTCDISRGHSRFGHWMHIDQFLNTTFQSLGAERQLAELSQGAFTERLAHYLGEVNAMHPFREGNGRAQREFFRQLAFKRGYHIAWDELTQDEIYDASERSHMRGDNSGLLILLRRAVRPV